MIPGLDPDPESDFQSYWRLQIQIRIYSKKGNRNTSNSNCHWIWSWLAPLRVPPDCGVWSVPAVALLPEHRLVVGAIQAEGGDRSLRQPVRAGAGRESVVAGALKDLVHHLQLFQKYFSKLYVQGGPSGQIVGLVWLWFWLFHPLPGCAWADGKLAEVDDQAGKMVEHLRSKSTQSNNPTRWTTSSAAK